MRRSFQRSPSPDEALQPSADRAPFDPGRIARVTVQDLGSVGELVAAVATVATFGHLAVQTRQNSESVRMSAEIGLYGRIVDITRETWRARIDAVMGLVRNPIIGPASAK